MGKQLLLVSVCLLGSALLVHKCIKSIRGAQQNIRAIKIDQGRPGGQTGTETPNPSIPALETVVRSHSAQLQPELTAAFSQVTGEIGELRTSTASTTTALTSLASQVAALTDMVARLLQSPATEPNPAPPADLPVTTPPLVSEGSPLDPRWEQNLLSPKPYNGEFN